MAPHEQQLLGSQGLKASRLGLGCMGMSAFYTDDSHKESESLDVLTRALELGVSHWDTSDAYVSEKGHNEELLAKVLKGRRQEVTLATKFGITQVDGKPVINGDPDYVKKAVTASLDRLGVDCIDLYYLHRVDTRRPIEETVGAMAELVKEGKVKYLGLSEVSPEDLRKAHAVHPISAVQLEYSLQARDVEKDLIPTCRELGIGIVAYSPLGRGMLAGTAASSLSSGDWRLSQPRWSGENAEKNAKPVETVKEIAKAKGGTPGQIALAWVLAQGDDVFPIPGTKRLKYLEENAGARDVELTAEDLAKLDAAFPADGSTTAGDRYGEGFANSTYDRYKRE